MSLAAKESQELLSFDPRGLPGLVAWWDGRYVNGFGVANPAALAAVTQWNDLSGNAHHLPDGAGTNAVTMSSTKANGLTFNSSRLRIGSGWPLLTALTVYSVFSCTNTSTSPRVIRVGDGGGIGWALSPAAAASTITHRMFSYTSAAGNAAIVATSSTTVDHGLHVTCATLDESQCLSTIYSDGRGPYASTTSPSPTRDINRSLNVGDSAASSGEGQSPLTGIMTDLLIFSEIHGGSALGDLKRHRITQWLAAKNAISAVIP